MARPTALVQRDPGKVLTESQSIRSSPRLIRFCQGATRGGPGSARFLYRISFVSLGGRPREADPMRYLLSLS